MEYVTKEAVRTKAARALGLDRPSALDVVNRSDYPTEEAYLNAAAEHELRLRDPQFREVRNRLRREHDERTEKEIRNEQREEYKAIRATVKLSDYDVKKIDVDAADLARRDLSAGRIGASDLGKTIELYAKKLSEKRKDELAANQQMNEFLRREVRTGRIGG